MPFITTAREQVKLLDPKSPTRVFLEYMLHWGVGVKNARAWPAIESIFAANGIPMSQKKFQQTILKQTRANGVFVGSTDEAPKPGYFLIKDFTDAEVMRKFYEKRITAEMINLDALKKLMIDQWGRTR